MKIQIVGADAHIGPFRRTKDQKWGDVGIAPYIQESTDQRLCIFLLNVIEYSYQENEVPL